MVAVDANFLLYVANERDPAHADALAVMERLMSGGEPWAVSWNVIYEFLRVVTHPRVFEQPLPMEQAWRTAVEWTGTAHCHRLLPTSRHRTIAEECLKMAPRTKGSLMHDFHTAVLMKEHGVTEILTRDVDFRCFPWVKIRSF